jgi:hypothetical protein
VTKQEIDTYFSDNWQSIKRVIQNNGSKCSTANRESIASEIYLICVDKAEKITNIDGFVRILASNIYRWNRSKFNLENKIFSSELEVKDEPMNEEYSEVDFQNRMYAIEKYRLHAKPSEKILLNLYMTETPTVRGLQRNLGISFHGAVVMIKEFKEKIKSYEREIEKSEQD